MSQSDSNKWIENLERMRRLADGWNGYRAPAPSKLAVDLAHGFIRISSTEKCEPTRVAPSVEGGVGVTHRKGRRRVYVEFFNDGKVHALFSDDVGPPRSEPIKPHTARLTELTKRIAEYLDA